MPAAPNIGPLHRALYVLAGFGLIICGLYYLESTWARWTVVLLGCWALIEGVIGFCLTVRILGLGRDRQPR